MTAIGDSTPVKACTKCGEEKPATAEFFPKRSALLGKLAAHCKECAKAAKKAYYLENQQKIKDAANEYYRKNTAVAKELVLTHYRANKEKVQSRVKKYVQENKDKIKKARAEAYQAQKDKVKAEVSRYYQANKERVQLSQAEWRSRNKHRVRAYSANYAQKVKENPLLLLQVRYRQIVSKAWRGQGFARTSRSHEILGCTWEEFRRHIERQFTRGMGWDRIEEIHLDHIVALSTAQTEEDVVALNHYTNLRPLWAKENMSKGAQITHLI